MKMYNNAESCRLLISADKIEGHQMNLVRRGHISVWNGEVGKISLIFNSPQPIYIIILSVIRSFIAISKTFTRM